MRYFLALFLASLFFGCGDSATKSSEIDTPSNSPQIDDNSKRPPSVPKIFNENINK